MRPGVWSQLAFFFVSMTLTLGCGSKQEACFPMSARPNAEIICTR